MRTIRALIPIAAACVSIGGATAAQGQEPGDLPEPAPATDEEIYQATCGHLGTPCVSSAGDEQPRAAHPQRHAGHLPPSPVPSTKFGQVGSRP